MIFFSVTGRSRGITFRSTGLFNSRGHRRMAIVETPSTSITQTSGASGSSLSVGAFALDWQFCPCVRFCLWFSSVVRATSVHNIRAIRKAEKNCVGVGVSYICWCDAVCVNCVVLRCAGVWMRRVCVFYLFTVRSRHVCVTGRARAAARRRMTARGPGAPAAAAPPPCAPRPTQAIQTKPTPETPKFLRDLRIPRVICAARAYTASPKPRLPPRCTVINDQFCLSKLWF